MKTGKLDSKLLEEIVFKHLSHKRPEVITRAGIGEDCAVIDFGDYDCVLSTDPITGAVSDIGRLAVHISCNDIASKGIEPLGMLLACMLPEGITIEEIDTIMAQAGEAATELNIEIIGGHTEVTAAVNTPVIVSTALGRALKGQVQGAANMKAGDFVLMTKGAGIEGAGIIASDFSHELEAVLSKEEIEEALSLLEQVSVVKEGVIAGSIGTSGMHDITEGGVLGAVWEMCQVSGKGSVIEYEKIPINPVVMKICKHFNIDPLRLISSGSMLIVAPPENREKIEKAIRAAGIEVSCIGEVNDREGECILIKDGKMQIIDPPGSDELYKVVFSNS